MLPPPITTPISTPRRATCATSATMSSMVCRLMPNGSSPIRASPDSLRRMRLYLGVTTRLKDGFSMDLLGFLDTLADYQERIAMHLRLLGREHFFNGLLVVLDERLTEQRDLPQELVDRALDHPARNLFGLARFLCSRQLDIAFSIH